MRKDINCGRKSCGLTSERPHNSSPGIRTGHLTFSVVSDVFTRRRAVLLHSSHKNCSATVPNMTPYRLLFTTFTAVSFAVSAEAQISIAPLTSFGGGDGWIAPADSTTDFVN